MSTLYAVWLLQTHLVKLIAALTELTFEDVFQSNKEKIEERIDALHLFLSQISIHLAVDGEEDAMRYAREHWQEHMHCECDAFLLERLARMYDASELVTS